MYMVAGLLLKKTTVSDLVKVWVISWVTNFIGAAIMAFFFGYLTDYANWQSPTGPKIQEWLISKTAYKVQGMGWGVVFLKGILCNTLVNCAVWAAGTCNDTSGASQLLSLALFWHLNISFFVNVPCFRQDHGHLVANHGLRSLWI